MKTSGTGGELKLRKILEDMGLEIEPNKAFPPFEVDVYCPEIHAAFEYDGAGWHSFRTRDIKRDQTLNQIYHLHVFRVRDSFDNTEEPMAKFVEHCSLDAMCRRQRFDDDHLQ